MLNKVCFLFQVDSLSSTIAADGRYVCSCVHACVCVCISVQAFLNLFVSVMDESYPPRPAAFSSTLRF